MVLKFLLDVRTGGFPDLGPDEVVEFVGEQPAWPGPLCKLGSGLLQCYGV